MSSAEDYTCELHPVSSHVHAMTVDCGVMQVMRMLIFFMLTHDPCCALVGALVLNKEHLQPGRIWIQKVRLEQSEENETP